MAITIGKSGNATAADLQQLRIFRANDGALTAEVTYRATVLGQQESRTATWSLTAAEKGAIGASLLAGALAAVDAA